MSSGEKGRSRNVSYYYYYYDYYYHYNIYKFAFRLIPSLSGFTRQFHAVNVSGYWLTTHLVRRGSRHIINDRPTHTGKLKPPDLVYVELFVHTAPVWKIEDSQRVNIDTAKGLNSRGTRLETRDGHVLDRPFYRTLGTCHTLCYTPPPFRLDDKQRR